ncbi:beta-ketoacyl-[acyl-carrier-protein] synthase family protein [Streptomyces specialis]|uniref:beta-ketoacyl-[acyl-carrier-protein] synthase family protein n=1 Tax=Streptomyces specialis TaxID=498367 RepID=UPI00073F2C7F|nr:beta-ketoacyl-[acyl-carrier-protein] synthase family protein [Streptomyces specialis]
MRAPGTPPFAAAITGLGIVSAAGIGAKATWDSVLHGSVGHITRLPALAGLPQDFLYDIPDFDADAVLGRSRARQMDRFAQLAVAAAREALADAGLEPSDWDATRVAVLVGSSHGGLTVYDEQTRTMNDKGDRRVSPLLTPLSLLNAAAGSVCLDTGARGPSMGLAAACASGATAIGTARMMLQAGLCDIAIAGGAESMRSRALFASCCRARAVSTRTGDPAAALRPFDADRDGMVSGEGAGMLILERPEHARARGADIRALVTGYGASSDGHSPAAPDPTGAGIERALRDALADAGLAPSDLDMVNAHGTATIAGDAIEAAMLHRVLPHHPPVTSTKAVTGHTLGASGAIETALTVLAMETSAVPPTANLERQDPDVHLDIPTGRARPARLAAAAKTSLGFGGHNAALVLTRA